MIHRRFLKLSEYVPFGSVMSRLWHQSAASVCVIF